MVLYRALGSRIFAFGAMIIFKYVLRAVGATFECRVVAAINVAVLLLLEVESPDIRSNVLFVMLLHPLNLS